VLRQRLEAERRCGNPLNLTARNRSRAMKRPTHPPDPPAASSSRPSKRRRTLGHADRVPSIARLAAGVGILKVARELGSGSGTVQRIKREAA
jgi:hypothetical protein